MWDASFFKFRLNWGMYPQPFLHVYVITSQTVSQVLVPPSAETDGDGKASARETSYTQLKKLAWPGECDCSYLLWYLPHGYSCSYGTSGSAHFPHLGQAEARGQVLWSAELDPSPQLCSLLTSEDRLYLLLPAWSTSRTRLRSHTGGLDVGR